MRKTNYQFKILYALGMIFIVSGHTRGGGISILYDWFPMAGFQLALFMFASGYFYTIGAEDNLIQYVWKKIKHLMIPFYLYTFAYGLFAHLMWQVGFEIGRHLTLRNLIIEPIKNGHQFSYNLPGWFIVPLFMVQMYNIFVRKMFALLKIKYNEWAGMVVRLILGMLGVTLAINGYNYGWWLVLVRMLYMLPFYQMGILYKVHLESKDTAPNWLYIGIIAIIQLSITTYYGKPLTYAPSWCQDFKQGCVMPFVVGMLGVAFWLRISRILEPVLKNSKIVMAIADNTYSIMMNQYLGIFILNGIYALLHTFTPLCSDFLMDEYFTNLSYFYMPKQIMLWLVLYLIMGLAVPIFIQKGIDIFKDKLKRSV